jgi:hypothetical protein
MGDMMDRRKYLAILSVLVISSLYMNVCKAEAGRGGGIASFLALLLMMALIGGFVIVILVIVYKLATRKKEKLNRLHHACNTSNDENHTIVA